MTRQVSRGSFRLLVPVAQLVSQVESQDACPARLAGAVRALLEDHPDPWRVSTEDLTDWLASHRYWSRATRSSYRDGLRGFYGWLVDTNRMGRSPAEGIPKVTVPRRMARPAPAEAIRAGLAYHDERVRLMVELGARCGLRRAEIAGIHSRDVCRDASGWSLVVHGKGDRERLIPLPEEFAERLRARGPGWLFPRTDDPTRHLHPQYVGELVSRALPDGWTTHTLRHSFATQAYAGSRDLLAVQQLLGHSSVSTTQLYVAVPRSSLRAAVDAVRLPDAA